MTGGQAGQFAAERQHVVQFYAADDELVTRAGEFVRTGLQAGERVIVVATGEHCRAFAAYLAAAGAELASARGGGDLVWLDAATLLDRLVAGGRPDPATFDAVIGGLIGQTADRPVRVFGEMVAVLWNAGQIGAAIELEALWNGLAERLSFFLFCAYRADPAADTELTAALAQVCGMHSAVLTDEGEPAAGGGLTPVRTCAAVRDLPLDLDSPRAARHFVLAELGQQAGSAVASDVALAATELAANAVVHARSAFTVAVGKADHAVRIAVSDARVLDGEADGGRLVAVRGRGLGIVDLVARRWEAEPLPGGKVVWAELPAGA
jgi:anti-sigma regulatory factor (Ser/Thr protein kinase)